MSELRIARLNQTVCQEFNNILRTIYRDILRDVTVTEVNVSPDMHDACVYVSILGDSENKKLMFGMLTKRLKAIKKQLFERVQIKYSPRIVLRIDHSIERGHKVLDILDSLKNNE
ncbi:MAG: 30S ribosome-binding factor RbfA [Opitutales bacterium]|nr:30S ribosome-binding factor RbfA [Opitutales bacterium]